MTYDERRGSDARVTSKRKERTPNCETLRFEDSVITYEFC